MAHYSNLGWNYIRLSCCSVGGSYIFVLVSLVLQKHGIHLSMQTTVSKFGLHNQIRIALPPEKKKTSLTLYSKALLYKIIYIWQKMRGSD